LSNVFITIADLPTENCQLGLCGIFSDYNGCSMSKCPMKMLTFLAISKTG